MVPIKSTLGKSLLPLFIAIFLAQSTAPARADRNICTCRQHPAESVAEGVVSRTETKRRCDCEFQNNGTRTISDYTSQGPFAIENQIGMTEFLSLTQAIELAQLDDNLEFIGGPYPHLLLNPEQDTEEWYSPTFIAEDLPALFALSLVPTVSAEDPLQIFPVENGASALLLITELLQNYSREISDLMEWSADVESGYANWMILDLENGASIRTDDEEGRPVEVFISQLGVLASPGCVEIISSVFITMVKNAERPNMGTCGRIPDDFLRELALRGIR